MTPQEQYQARLKRVEDTIQLKVPDRVPFFPMTHGFAAKYTGMTLKEAYYDAGKWLEANKLMNIDLEPDILFPPLAAVITSGDAFEAVDFRQLNWPGHGVPDNHTHQFVEGEYMMANEYDALLDDPSDFALRVYMPRVYGTLGPFKMLPPIKSMLGGYSGPLISTLFVVPEVIKAFESIRKMGLETTRYMAANITFEEEMEELGFPAFTSSMTPIGMIPFDFISDYLRGMRGTMLDMYRQPGKLLEAIERLYPMLIGSALWSVKMSKNPRVYIPLHRGADGFMSNGQFETFYWPTLKRFIIDLIDGGGIPCIYWEGIYDSRLQYLTELPRGKILGIFQRTDLVKAKDILGDNMCIAGGMPVSLLQTGTPLQVKEYTKGLIDLVGDGGGVIMTSSGPLDDADPELARVWRDATREYGLYS